MSEKTFQQLYYSRAIIFQDKNVLYVENKYLRNV